MTDAELDAVEAQAREELPRPYYGSDPAQTLALVSALREARAACREAAVALTPKHLNADDCPGCGEPMLGDGNTGDGPALFGHWAECRLAGAWLMLRKVDPTLLDWMNDGK
jgi:hypothetical protein